MAAYSLDMHEKIVAAYQGGNTSVRKVAARFMVSPGVVNVYLNKTEKRVIYPLAPLVLRPVKAY